MIEGIQQERRRPIGMDEVVSVKGRYLFKQDGTRFLMKGIAFPDQVVEWNYDATAWISILHQLESLHLDYNTVRIYRMNPEIDYSEFFHAAASLGIYVIVPLTSAQGGGVLDRDKDAPHCYKQDLFHYGIKCLQNYLEFPNVLAGLISNEVMNSLASWNAAPCVKAYGRDLKRYMKDSSSRPLPLIYAAQNSDICPGINVDDSMRLTSEYLTCQINGNNGDSAVATAAKGDDDNSSIDIFGINIESWCSSTESFKSDFGSSSAYYYLWKALSDSAVPVVFTEMGCSRLDFDKNTEQAKEFRDWKQVPLVLEDMNDVFSGFCAYAYDGNDQFNMFEGGPWVNTPLKPTKDFFNFQEQLRNVSPYSSPVSINTTSPYKSKYISSSSSELDKSNINFANPLCKYISEEFHSHCGIHLYEIQNIPHYSMPLYMKLHFHFSSKFLPKQRIHLISWVFVSFIGYFIAKLYSKRSRRSSSSSNDNLLREKIASYGSTISFEESEPFKVIA